MDQGTEGDVESCLEGKADNESIRGDVWWGFLNMTHVLRVHWRGRPFLRTRKPSGSIQTLQGESGAFIPFRFRELQMSVQACGWKFLGACDPIHIYIVYIHTSLGIDIHTYTCSVVLYLNNSAHWIKYLLYLLEVH